MATRCCCPPLSSPTMRRPAWGSSISSSISFTRGPIGLAPFVQLERILDVLPDIHMQGTARRFWNTKPMLRA